MNTLTWSWNVSALRDAVLATVFASVCFAFAEHCNHLIPTIFK